MQQSASNDSLLAAVEAALGELESLCGRMERALMRREWSELDGAIADSRRFMHALQNAMDDAREIRTKSFDDNVFRRLRYLQMVRDNQMIRLQSYHDAVGERLRLVARWKSALKSITSKLPSRGLSALNEMR